jgi:hypothetical protein
VAKAWEYVLMPDSVLVLACVDHKGMRIPNIEHTDKQATAAVATSNQLLLLLLHNTNAGAVTANKVAAAAAALAVRPQVTKLITVTTPVWIFQGYNRPLLLQIPHHGCPVHLRLTMQAESAPS